MAAAIFSIVAAAACITAPPWLAVSAETRLELAALSALWLISPMVAVISCAAAAIWLVLLDWVWALPAVWTERALISVVAAESVSAPWATECSTLRMEVTLVFKAVDKTANLIRASLGYADRQILFRHPLQSGRGACKRRRDHAA